MEDHKLRYLGPRESRVIGKSIINSNRERAANLIEGMMTLSRMYQTNHLLKRLPRNTIYQPLSSRIMSLLRIKF